MVVPHEFGQQNIESEGKNWREEFILHDTCTMDIPYISTFSQINDIFVFLEKQMIFSSLQGYDWMAPDPEGKNFEREINKNNETTIGPHAYQKGGPNASTTIS